MNLLNQSLQNESSKCYHLSGFENTVFGFASSGQLNAELDLDVRDGIKGHLTFAACSMSQVFVRDTSCERRHPQLPDKDLCEDISRLVCTDKSEPPLRVSRCHTKPLESGSRNQLFLSADPELSERITLKPTNESIPADSHAMYFAIVVFCPSDSSEQSDAAFDLTGNMNYSNPSSVRRGLGFEETLFPLLSQVVLYMLATLCVSLMLSLIITPLLRLPFRQLPFAVLFACLTKGIMALFTFLYFSSVATDGSRARWYTYTKICLAGVADVSFIVVVIAMSSGYNLFPTVWFIDGRSPLMFVYIGVTLQILIIIIVKIMFPFKYLSEFLLLVVIGTKLQPKALVLISLSNSFSFMDCVTCRSSSTSMSTRPILFFFYVPSCGHILRDSWCHGSACHSFVTQKLPFSRTVRGFDRARSHLRQDDTHSTHAKVFCCEPCYRTNSLHFQDCFSWGVGLRPAASRSHVGMLGDYRRRVADVVHVCSSTT